jgi:hypothetical protein
MLWHGGIIASRTVFFHASSCRSLLSRAASPTHLFEHLWHTLAQLLVVGVTPVVIIITIKVPNQAMASAPSAPLGVTPV